MRSFLIETEPNLLLPTRLVVPSEPGITNPFVNRPIRLYNIYFTYFCGFQICVITYIIHEPTDPGQEHPSTHAWNLGAWHGITQSNPHKVFFIPKLAAAHAITHSLYFIWMPETKPNLRPWIIGHSRIRTLVYPYLPRKAYQLSMAIRPFPCFSQSTCLKELSIYSPSNRMLTR